MSKYMSDLPARTDIEPTDHLIGYRSSTSGGSGRWTFATLRAWIETFSGAGGGGDGASGGVVGRPSFTGYSGGGVTDIHTITTTTLPVGTVVLTPNMPPARRQWQIVSGLDAEDQSAGVIRPSDFNASTNAKILKLF